MGRYGYPIALLVVCAMSACGSAPPQAQANPDTRGYWSDPFWQERLLYAVQSAVHQPTDADKTPITGVNAMVRFTVADGVIVNPEIVASTGYADLDKLMLQQVASVKPPETSGPHANEPHEFELLLDMLTPFDSFQYNIYRAIDYQKVYPKDGILAGAVGNNAVDFDYLDGKATNIAMTISSKSRDLDKATMGAVTKAVLPPAPPAYAGKPLHIEAIFCYTINNIPNCPAGMSVIDVRAVRIKRITMEHGFGGYR